VREGLSKHFTAHDHPARRKEFAGKSSSLEAQVANLADEIAYYSHDLDDGLDSGLLSEKQLNREVRLWRQAARSVVREYGALPDECRRSFIIRCIIDLQVKDVVNTSEGRIRAAGVASADEVRRQPKPSVDYSPERRKLNRELRDFLYEELYFNPVVNEPHLRARKILEELFRHYLQHHAEVGSQARRRARRDGWPRAICDYLAGMTDRYAMLEHERLIRAQTKRV
jgi:dGTPase